MSSLDSIPGQSGIIAIIADVLVVSVIITLVTSALIHWVPVTTAIIVGVWAVKAINQ